MYVNILAIEEQSGRKVILVRQTRGPDTHSKLETMRSTKIMRIYTVDVSNNY